jgi:hypothetical protein
VSSVVSRSSPSTHLSADHFPLSIPTRSRPTGRAGPATSPPPGAPRRARLPGAPHHGVLGILWPTLINELDVTVFDLVREILELDVIDRSVDGPYPRKGRSLLAASGNRNTVDLPIADSGASKRIAAPSVR